MVFRDLERVFRKGGRKKKCRREWREEKVGTLKEWKYLGVNLRSNNSMVGHLTDEKEQLEQ